MNKKTSSYKGYTSSIDLINNEGILPMVLSKMLYELPDKGILNRCMITWDNNSVFYIADEDIPAIREFYRKHTSWLKRLSHRYRLKLRPYNENSSVQRMWYPGMAAEELLEERKEILKENTRIAVAGSNAGACNNLTWDPDFRKEKNRVVQALREADSRFHRISRPRIIELYEEYSREEHCSGWSTMTDSRGLEPFIEWCFSSPVTRMKNRVKKEDEEKSKPISDEIAPGLSNIFFAQANNAFIESLKKDTKAVAALGDYMSIKTGKEPMSKTIYAVCYEGDLHSGMGVHSIWDTKEGAYNEAVKFNNMYDGSAGCGFIIMEWEVNKPGDITDIINDHGDSVFPGKPAKPADDYTLNTK